MPQPANAPSPGWSNNSSPRSQGPVSRTRSGYTGGPPSQRGAGGAGAPPPPPSPAQRARQNAGAPPPPPSGGPRRSGGQRVPTVMGPPPSAAREAADATIDAVEETADAISPDALEDLLQAHAAHARAISESKYDAVLSPAANAFRGQIEQALEDNKITLNELVNVLGAMYDMLILSDKVNAEEIGRLFGYRKATDEKAETALARTERIAEIADAVARVDQALDAHGLADAGDMEENLKRGMFYANGVPFNARSIMIAYMLIKAARLYAVNDDSDVSSSSFMDRLLGDDDPLLITEEVGVIGTNAAGTPIPAYDASEHTHVMAPVTGGSSRAWQEISPSHPPSRTAGTSTPPGSATGSRGGPRQACRST